MQKRRDGHQLHKEVKEMELDQDLNPMGILLSSYSAGREGPVMSKTGFALKYHLERGKDKTSNSLMMPGLFNLRTNATLSTQALLEGHVARAPSLTT